MTNRIGSSFPVQRGFIIVMKPGQYLSINKNRFLFLNDSLKIIIGFRSHFQYINSGG